MLVINGSKKNTIKNKRKLFYTYQFDIVYLFNNSTLFITWDFQETDVFVRCGLVFCCCVKYIVIMHTKKNSKSSGSLLCSNYVKFPVKSVFCHFIGLIFVMKLRSSSRLCARITDVLRLNDRENSSINYRS